MTPTPTAAFDLYWYFAAERHRIYLARVAGDNEMSRTDDPIIAKYRFTNVFRASDRVSQYLISNVIYDESRAWPDTFARVLLFKIFNKIETWEHILESLGQIGVRQVMSGEVDRALKSRASCPLYNAAYIMPPPRSFHGPKYQRHLELLRSMIVNRCDEAVARARSLGEIYQILRQYESLGPFLAYQYAIDLNYSPHLGFSESEFVVAGPGARRGIQKAFSSAGGLSTEDIIRWVVDSQEESFGERGLRFDGLWGRRMQLIDVQNVFCEFDKYTRVALPGLGRSSRIKQLYRPAGPISAQFPPKWGIEGRVAGPTALDSASK